MAPLHRYGGTTYPSVLSNIVFSNAQVLLDKVTELFHFNYSLYSNSPPVALEGKTVLRPGHCATDMLDIYWRLYLGHLRLPEGLLIDL